ncbi:MAG: bacillithiol system redox-active protein YtxJ [Saprospiraceae bacterium]|nr:bacillithiol system redox-active protein YtxJ [Saprospiraceae bacterium]
MINWKPFDSLHVLQEVIRKSYVQRVFIFKHSSRCSISSIAKLRLEDHWNSSLSENSEVYLLDVITHRDISNEVAAYFEVHHESPQILLIENGECTHDASHFDISVEEIQEVI